MDLNAFKAILLDLDGTVWEETTPLPGAAELVRTLHKMGKHVAYVSNSNSSPKRVVEKLAKMNIVANDRDIVTASSAACERVLAMFERPRVFNLGTQSVYVMLEGKAEFVERPDQPCDAILVATPVSELAGEARQRTALALARNGAAIIGMCADRVFVSPRGIEFGAGALAIMLGYAADKPVEFCGKPGALFFQTILDHLNVKPSDCVLIGDNLEADIAGGNRMGMKTILTLTGVHQKRDIASYDTDHTPSYIADSLESLVSMISGVK